jgi:hypothetical protein
MIEYWADETIAFAPKSLDPVVVREGLRLLKELSRPSPDTTCPLTTDLHAGNVLRARRDLLEVDPERVRVWMFARAAAQLRDTWSEDSMSLARALA